MNALLAYALIHGHYGLPRLDLLGAGLATTFVNIGMCVAAVWICYACRPFKKYRVLARHEVRLQPSFSPRWAGIAVSGRF